MTGLFAVVLCVICLSLSSHINKYDITLVPSYSPEHFPPYIQDLRILNKCLHIAQTEQLFVMCLAYANLTILFVVLESTAQFNRSSI